MPTARKKYQMPALARVPGRKEWHDTHPPVRGAGDLHQVLSDESLNPAPRSHTSKALLLAQTAVPTSSCAAGTAPNDGQAREIGNAQVPGREPRKWQEGMRPGTRGKGREQWQGGLFGSGRLRDSPCPTAAPQKDDS